ncbi:MAG: TonB-dependent receptor [Porphyromonadaceae bacterium]|nr:MAG: TonB-dependent receptor [Porphyromonadaceae bacterium]
MQISSNVRRIALFFLSMVLSSGIIFAQERTITGKVTAEGEGPLPGVNVTVQGTVIGAITDLNGAYSIKVPGPTSVLLFSSIGYSTKQVTVGIQSVIDVLLESDVTALQEIVVVGYSTRLKDQLTGAVSSVTEKELKISAAPSTISRLQGHVSGVNITTSNTPGGDATIRIRGVGTINDPDPLYVIDGVPVGPGNNINPNDVESISVLKDASSAAIYGSRGANGVILITTKKGTKNQKASVVFSARTGFKQATNQYNLLNTKEYGEALWLQAKNLGTVNYTHPQYGSGPTPVIPDYILPAGAKIGDPGTDASLYKYPDYVIFKANKTGTNWYDEIYQNAVVNEYNLQVSGGGNNTTYSLSTSYLNENGILKWTDFKRYNFRINVESSLSNWFKVGQSLQAIFINQNGDFGNNSEGSAISMAYRMQPIIPVYDIGGNFAGSKAPGMGNAGNPVAQLNRAQNNDGKWMRALGTSFAEATIIKGLSIKTLLGYNVGIWNYKGYTLPTYEASEPNKVPGMNQNTNYSIFWNWVNTINYNVTIGGDHKLSVVVGTEAFKNTYQEFGASRSQYFNLSPNYMYLSSGELNKDNYGYGSANSMFSQFGRVNYDLAGKYYVEATVRRDGSSRFGANKRYGVFPAASAAWVISKEGFMSSTSNWLNLLKLRAGYGTAGNDRIGDYNGFSTFSTNGYTAAYNFTGSNTSAIAGFEPSTKGSNNVSWETTRTLNFGLDSRLLNNTLSLTLEVWTRSTTDMLYRLSVPEVMGLAQPPYVNIGDMKNTGFDIQVGYNNSALDGKFTYAVTLIGSHYKNELVKLSDNEKEIIYFNTRQVDYSAATIGHPFPEFYGYKVKGIFQTNAQAAAAAPFDSYNKPGHFEFEDLNGDGVITPADRTFIGSPHPKFTGGLNIDLGYSGFDLNIFFYGSYGNKIINYVSRWIDYGQFNGGLSKDVLYDSWTSTNTTARLPMFDQDSHSQYNSTAFVEDGSFLRLKNLRLGYTLPQSVLSKIKVQSMRLYLQTTNLFTITKYRGLDPELDASGMGMGIDQGAWPTPREIIIGLTLGL